MIDSSTIKFLSKTTNNYCIYISNYNLEYAMQLNILQKNIKEKYSEINFYFAFHKDVIKDLKLPNNFITIEDMQKNKSIFSVCEEISITPKGSAIQDYCEKNDIKLLVNDIYPSSKDTEIIVFTKNIINSKSLDEVHLNKLKTIFGQNIVINPPNFQDNTRGRFVIGTECWQIFCAANKNLPTHVITNNGNYSGLFLKMFPKQKKIEL